jgi:hypothetical protein
MASIQAIPKVVALQSAGKNKERMRAMMDSTRPQTPPTHPPPESEGARDEWKTPTVVQLPRLSELTLQSGTIPGGGDSGGGGSTVVP